MERGRYYRNRCHQLLVLSDDDDDDDTDDDDDDDEDDCPVIPLNARFHEITDKWIREHRQDYRGNRTGDLQDAYLEKINKGVETFSSEVERIRAGVHFVFPYIKVHSAM